MSLRPDAPRIVSAQFVGKNALACRHMIYSPLGKMMKLEVHTVNIQANTPDEI